MLISFLILCHDAENLELYKLHTNDLKWMGKRKCRIDIPVVILHDHEIGRGGHSKMGVNRGDKKTAGTAANEAIKVRCMKPSPPKKIHENNSIFVIPIPFVVLLSLTKNRLKKRASCSLD